MSRTTTSSSDRWDGSAPFTTLPAAGATELTWYKSTAIAADGQFVSVDAGTLDLQAWSLIVGSGGVSGLVGGYTFSTSGSSVNANAAGLLPNAVWHFVASVFYPGGSSRAAFNSTTKGTDSRFVTPPAGVNAMHYNGINNRGIAGQHAHRGVALRAYSDIELAYLASGGQPSNLGIEHYHQLDSAGGTESDIGSSASPITMTVHGTTAGSDDPDFASYWTAAALGPIAWTQATPISSIDFTTKFRNVHSAYTTTLKTLSAGSQVTTAVGAGTASNLMTVNSVVGIAVGSYVSDGPSGTQALVLFISGTTLLLNTFLSWATSDPIYAYTATTKTFTGPSITANVLSGTPAAGDVGTYTLIARTASNANSALIADSPPFTITVVSSGSTPSFTAGPTLTSTQINGHTFTVTSNQTATCWLGYYLKGSSQPGAPALIAGTGTGFIGTSGSHPSQALTLNVANTITSTGLLDPIADGYLCLTNINGNSAVVPFTALMKAAPAGKQYPPITVVAVSAVTKASPAQVTATAHGRTTGDYVQVYGLGGMVELNALFTATQTVQCTVVDANNVTLNGIDSTLFTTYTSGGYLSFGASMYAQATTLPVTGDIGVWDTVTAENGLPVTAFPNGRYSIAAGNVTARQSWAVDFYKVSTGTFIGVATDYVANQPPFLVQQTIGGPLPAIFLPANQTIPTTNVVSGFAQDPEGDTLTPSFAAVPPGISVSGQNATGTTGAAQILQTTVTFTDKAGEQTPMDVAWVIGQINPPQLAGAGLTQAAADRLLAATYLSGTYASQPDPNSAGPAAAGTVIFQNPPFGTPVQPNTVINVTLSDGTSSFTTPVTPVVPVGAANSPQIQQEETAGRLNQFPIVEGYGVVTMAAGDPSGKVYRACRIPTGARVTEVLITNDPNPSGSTYNCGVLISPTGGVVVTGSDRIFYNQITMDMGRPLAVNLYQPAIVGGAPMTANFGLRVWELLGLAVDPSQSTLQDVLYDVCITAVNPGANGGSVAVRVKYYPPPPRGLAIPVESPW